MTLSTSCATSLPSSASHPIECAFPRSLPARRLWTSTCSPPTLARGSSAGRAAAATKAPASARLDGVLTLPVRVGPRTASTLSAVCRSTAQATAMRLYKRHAIRQAECAPAAVVRALCCSTGGVWTSVLQGTRPARPEYAYPATPPVATRASARVQTSAPSAIRSAPMHTRSTVSASRAAPTVSSPTRTVCANRARPRAKPALDHAPHSALAACRTAALQALARQTSSRSCSSRRLRKSPRLALV